MTRAGRVIAFIETYCRVPEGKLVGKPLVLDRFQKRFIVDVYDNKHMTARAILSMARKNGKTALIACLVLVHLVGPEALQNSQIISGARSREQAALVFDLAVKMVRLNPQLASIISITPSGKRLRGLIMNVEYRAISAEAGTAHGLSPVLAILDEVGQVKGPKDAFIEAIETAQGAHDNPLLIAISTQAAEDGDMLSIWIDNALSTKDPRVICHLYTAPEGAALDDADAMKAANPALGTFRSLDDLMQSAKRAMELPSYEQSHRWLFLNQRVEATAPFISKNVWTGCSEAPHDIRGLEVYGGLDLSASVDLTALVLIAKSDNKWNMLPTFWMPDDIVKARAKEDRQPYDLWVESGHLNTIPGKAIEYQHIARLLFAIHHSHRLRKIAFDRWNFKYLRPWLIEAGFSDDEIEEIFVEFGQGFASMSPAMRDFEVELVNGNIRHGGHPVLTMCAANSRVAKDPAGNRKIVKGKSTGRVDGMVAAVMAFGVAPLSVNDVQSFWETMA